MLDATARYQAFMQEFPGLEGLIPQYHKRVSREMTVNFMAPVKLTACLLPLMMQSPSRIIVISSLLQLAAKPGAPGYCASKAALSNWAGNLRCQLVGSPVSVTEVIPGLIKTDMTPEAREMGEPPERLAERVVKYQAKNRIVLPGARLAWTIAQLAPGLIRKKLSSC